MIHLETSVLMTRLKIPSAGDPLGDISFGDIRRTHLAVRIRQSAGLITDKSRSLDLVSEPSRLMPGENGPTFVGGE